MSPRWSGRWAAPLAASIVGLAAVGVGVVGMTSAGAAAAPGSGLGAIDITATADGLRAPLYSNGGEDVEGEVPHATASMQTGGVSHALTSMFWPGDTGGHGGDTLALLGTPCLPWNPNGVIPANLPCLYQPSPPPPSVYNSLNDPYRAEAQSGRGPATVKAGGNGVAMVATAHSTDALASTTLSGSTIPSAGDQFGKTVTTTSLQLVGSHTAVVDATSVVHDISLAGGVVTIREVTSVAHATSDTRHGVGAAQTTVTGMKVAGISVSVDDKGVHAGPGSSPLPSTDQVNKALAQAGISVFVAKPSKAVRGAMVTLDAGSLVVMENNPKYKAEGNDTGLVLTFGGASIQADTSKGFTFALPPLPPLPPAAAATTAGTAGTPGTPGGPALPGGGSAPADTGNAPVVAGPRMAPSGFALPGGIETGWIIVTLLGAVFAAAGLRRVAEGALAATGPACGLERSGR